jgi:DNA end-binding protein Ku
MVDAVTEEEVPAEEQVKGYAVGKDTYVQVEDDELSNIAIESSHTVDIEKFVPKSSIDDRYRNTPYYLAAEDEVGQEAFAVIRDAMKKKKMVGIARVVMARRERVMMLEPFGKGIMGLSITHIFRADVDTDLDVGEAGQAAPHDNVAGRWIAGSREVAAEARQLREVVR